jgi:hypothetical protein
MRLERKLSKAIQNQTLESVIGSVEVQFCGSYLGPPSNIGDKHEVACGKVAEITPPKSDQS